VLRKLKLRKLSFLALSGGLLASSAVVRAQDAQPSVADAARQARKDKDKNGAPAKTIVTEDSIASGTVAGSAKLADTRAPVVSGKSGSLDGAWARLQATEASLDRLEPLGPSELAQTVLNGNTTPFANRAEWEEKLYAAKGIYVQRSHQLIEAMKQVLTNMESLQSSGQGKIADNDPRVQALTRKSQQIMQLAARTEAAFQSLITEGQNLSLQTPPR
jgi:hypothetical protein